MNKVYEGPRDCPEIIPVFPLARVLLLPRGQMPLNIFEPRYLAMVDFALGGDRVIGMIQPDSDADPESEAPRLARKSDRAGTRNRSIPGSRWKSAANRPSFRPEANTTAPTTRTNQPRTARRSFDQAAPITARDSRTRPIESTDSQ